MKRHTLPALAAAVLLALGAGCGSNPAPTNPESLGSSEVDRSSAEATAVAFANIYATGDVPAACQLANDEGKEQLGSDCGSRQSWSTTVTLQSGCETKPSDAGGTVWLYTFDAPVGSLNRESGLRVKVEKASNDTMWWITSAGNNYVGVGQPSVSLCLKDQTSGPAKPTSSAAG